jgi:hypothetical protein
MACKCACALSGLLLSLQCAAAPITYHYQGQALDPIDPTSPPDLIAAMPSGVSSITATITLAAPVAPGAPGAQYQPLSFELSDGATFITLGTPGYSRDVYLQADAAGAIIAWAIGAADDIYGGDVVGGFVRMYSLGGDTNEEQTAYCGNVSPAGICLALPNRNSFNRPGTWTVEVVPIPPAIWLYGAALGTLGWLRRPNTARACRLTE